MALKKVFIQLLTRVAGIGKEGEIVEVSSAQAHNFLVPKKMAKIMSESDIAKMKNEQARSDEKKKSILANAPDIIATLQAQTVVLEVPGGKEKISGSIKEMDIVNAIKKNWKISLDEKHIVFADGKSIKTKGEHEVKIVLGKDLLAKITVVVRIK